MRTERRAFTLMELLVVIAIIGILAGLLFPAVNGALDSARKAQAKNDVVQIATAVTAYETEYGKLPVSGNSDVIQDVNKALMDTLMAISTNDNPRKIAFIEVGERKPTNAPAGKAGKSGLDASGYFVDPWGGKYRIVMDLDYNNTVNAGESPGPTASGLRKRVAVWNKAAGKDDTQKTRRSVTSWE